MRQLNDVKTVDSTHVEVLLPDRVGMITKRRAFSITNISTGGQKVFVSVGESAQLNKGKPLYVGGSWDMTINEEPPQNEITAISDIDGALISIYEESE